MADDLSDDKDDGTGGIFPFDVLGSLSDEALLLRDRKEGLLENIASFSPSVFDTFA